MNESVQVWGKPGCVRCKLLMGMLDQRGIAYEYVSIDNDSLKEDLLRRAPGVRTVPQVFVDGRHIGGYEEAVRELGL